MRTPCPSTACGLQMNSCCIFDKLAYETINNKHIMLSLNDDDDDAKALPTGVPKDDAMKKGGWGGQNVSKCDDVILVCSLIVSRARELVATFC